MEMETAAIQVGLAVYASDGRKLGRIAEVYPDIRVPTTAFSTGETTAAGFLTPGAIGTGVLAGRTAAGYFRVTPTPRGGDRPVLYIPFTEIKAIVPDRWVRLLGTADECAATYGSKPHVLV